VTRRLPIEMCGYSRLKSHPVPDNEGNFKLVVSCVGWNIRTVCA